MRHLSLIPFASMMACVTQNPASTSQDPPPAMFAGGSATTTGTGATGTATTGAVAPGEVVPSPCPYPVFRIASGVDITVSWDALTEDIDGNPFEPGENSAHLMASTLSVDAATAETLCGESFDPELSESRLVPLEDQPEATNPNATIPSGTVPNTLLPEGGAVFLTLILEDSAGDYRVAGLMLEPTIGPTVEAVAFTANMWVR